MLRDSNDWKRPRVWVLLALLVAGCTKSPPPHVPPARPPGGPQPPQGLPSAPNLLRGNIQFEGEPVRAGRVDFFDEKGKKCRECKIGSDGTFQMIGLPQGEYRAAVFVRDWPVADKDTPEKPAEVPPMPPLPPGPRGGPPGQREFQPPTPPLPALTLELKAKYDRIDEQYQDPAKSGLAVTVDQGVTELPVWTLKAHSTK